MKRFVIAAVFALAFLSGYASADFSASGANTYTYQWGSRYGGNDWAFVRTPSSYSPTGAPHELVVLNHGNGWTMSAQTTNFSDRPGAEELIQALLAEGFVVAGAQNDGGRYAGNAGYGNEETRQNIADFVDHLQRNFNVTSYCHMIGASNGALATLNAAIIMPAGKIRTITLLYPMINLQYAWSTSHTAGVQQAYPGATSFSSFSSVTRGHDPLSFMVYRTGLVSWTNEASANTDPQSASEQYKVTAFPWPRILTIYSNDDTVTPSAEHWFKFRTLLARGRFDYSELQVTGQHGSAPHFDVQAIIRWLRF